MRRGNEEKGPLVLLHVASHNAKKLKELKVLLEKSGVDCIELVSSSDLLGYPEPVENGRTFADNALIKARAGAKATGLVTLADDSGIAIDELSGMPGVLSARWCGRHGDDEANNKLVLAQLADVPVKRLSAQFVSVCAIVTPDGEEWIEKGVWPGRIVRKPVGDNGFGYDPLFVPAEEDERVAGTNERPRTSAELSPDEKNHLSHRYRALKALLPVLEELGHRAKRDGTSVTQEKATPLAVDVQPSDSDAKKDSDDSCESSVVQALTATKKKGGRK